MVNLWLIYSWLVVTGTWLWFSMIFPFSWECHHPNWLSYFFSGVAIPPISLKITRNLGWTWDELEGSHCLDWRLFAPQKMSWKRWVVRLEPWFSSSKKMRMSPKKARGLAEDEAELDIQDLTGWWFGTFCIFPYVGKNHPNWLFFKAVETTDQSKIERVADPMEDLLLVILLGKPTQWLVDTRSSWTPWVAWVDP